MSCPFEERVSNHLRNPVQSMLNFDMNLYSDFPSLEINNHLVNMRTSSKPSEFIMCR